MAVWGAGMALLEACLLGEEDAAIDMLLRGVACTAELAGFTPLMVRGAAMDGCGYICRCLSRLTCLCSSSYASMQAASVSGCVRLVRALLSQRDVDVDERDGNWRTALWWSCYHGVAPVVKTLVYDGQADVGAVDDDDKSPMSVALARGHTECAWLLQVRDQSEQEDRRNTQTRSHDVHACRRSRSDTCC